MINGVSKDKNLVEEKLTLCGICHEKEVNCIIKPCNHVFLCTECVERTIKCPLCLKFIEYFDKVYLPNN
jgi:hypothetical protein